MRAAALLVALAGVAHAAGGDADSRAQFKRATAHFSLGRFKQAAAEYEALYEKHPEQSVLLYNVAQSYRLAGDGEKALFFYKRYVANFPDAKNRREVDKRIAILQTLVDQMREEATAPPTTPAPVEPAPVITAMAPEGPVVVKSEPQKDKPLYKKWWLWTIVGGVVVVGAAVTVGVVLGTRHASSPSPYPDFGPGVGHALVTF